ncbi:glycosyltransferase [Sphingomonas japonica]|uniref:GT2 family glycosyltransferase n=1 Tax=Sphingomonas japonica TaxID=511662 RepID=A0ABX0TZ16_9SPHN|nr:glycosyltransferase [Sphingomonas japonica]NIJ23065.1 GT2 family glycosyltransferase [Sphingomonas japonica]
MTADRFCICVPARNEAERLPRLLDALAAQNGVGVVPVALCINNSDDGSVAAAETAARRHAGRLEIAIDDCRLPRRSAHVGTARGRAMDIGATLVGNRGVLISTDADCRPPPGWIAANLAAIDRGADLVGGKMLIDESEPLDPTVRAWRAMLDRYWAQVRAIEDRIDLQSHDPSPRHGDHGGASLAIRVATYRAAGGVPPLASGEDRALVATAVVAGGRLVHPIDVWTRVSPRAIGRATGGMASAMAEFQDLLRVGREPCVPAFDHWQQRAEWRLGQRTGGADPGEVVRREAALPPMPCDLPLSAVS